MRFVVVSIATSSGGAMTILKGFYNYVKNYSEHEWIFLLSDNYIEETNNVKVWLFPKQKQSKLSRLIFDFLSGRGVLKTAKASGVVYFQNTRIWGCRLPQIMYQDQSIPFQKIKKFSFFKRQERTMAIYQYLIGSMIKESTSKSEAVVVQTQWMKRAVMEQCRVNENRIYIIAPKIDLSELQGETAIPDYNISEFFYPASDAFYKNHKCIYEACHMLAEDKITVKVSLTIDGKDTSNVKHIGTVPYKEVLRRFCSSTLVFPSYIETYGLPLVEARRLNSIVLAADTEFSRELLDGYNNAYFFDYKKPAQLATLMKKVALGKIIRNDNPVVINKAGRDESWGKFHEICVKTSERNKQIQ